MREPTCEPKEGPLSDLKVLDLAGPIGVYCGKLMADLGADVVRIEPPTGDSMREIGPFFDDDPKPEKSLYWWHFSLMTALFFSRTESYYWSNDNS